MKTIVKIIVVLGSVLSCVMASAQDSCTNTVKINDSLVLSVSKCNMFEIPREFLKYSDSYSNVMLFAGFHDLFHVFHRPDGARVDADRVDPIF